MFTATIAHHKSPGTVHDLLHVLIFTGDRGGTVVKVLFYESEGRWFDPSWCHWSFSLT